MSYIIRVGNLAATPELRTAGSGGVYCYADVIVNDRERAEDGSYRDLGTVRYSLTVFRSAAEQLVETAQTSGNVGVLFAGRYRVREFDRRDGEEGHQPRRRGGRDRRQSHRPAGRRGPEPPQRGRGRADRGVNP